MPRTRSSDDLTAEECAIVDALRCCPESKLSEVCPVHAPLPVALVAYFEGMTERRVRRLLHLSLRRLAVEIGRDPELMELVSDYYTQICHD